MRCELHHHAAVTNLAFQFAFLHIGKFRDGKKRGHFETAVFIGYPLYIRN
jgi:hypothetical protein